MLRRGSVPGKVSGAWVFKDTRMPVAAVFDDLEAGSTIYEVMEEFAVTREQINALMLILFDHGTARSQNRRHKSFSTRIHKATTFHLAYWRCTRCEAFGEFADPKTEAKTCCRLGEVLCEKAQVCGYCTGRPAVTSLGLCGEIRAQPCDKFEVASIKLNTSGGGGSYPELVPGGRRLIATNQYLMAFLMFAYDVSPVQVSGVPSAFFQERYNIEATCEEPMTKEQLPHLLRSLLEERFHLSIHRELREQSVYALIVGKGSSKLRETKHETEQPVLRQVGHSFTFTNATMANLVGVLSQVAGRKVLDKTGLSAQYDFTLSYAPDCGGAGGEGDSPAADSFPDSVFTALREQLGLDLKPQRSEIEFIVFDHIEPLIPN